MLLSIPIAYGQMTRHHTNLKHTQRKSTKKRRVELQMRSTQSIFEMPNTKGKHKGAEI